jgi:hypothetical protein
MDMVLMTFERAASRCRFDDVVVRTGAFLNRANIVQVGKRLQRAILYRLCLSMERMVTSTRL